MSKSNPVRRAVRRVLLSSAAAAIVAPAVPVVAQEPAIQEVIVTGSRIRVRDFEAVSPVATVTSEAIQATGNLNVEEVLNNLPQIVPGFTASSNNPGDGTATVDLRGLGSTRTLVLINGRRLNPSSNDGTVDLNNVPVRLIDRVEVVTGGASAVYGSDALAGVVNFVLKDNFEGFEVGYQWGQTAEGDGTEKQVDLLLGGNFAGGRGNVTAYAGWYERDSILQADRFHTAVDLMANGSATGNARLPNAPLNPFPTYDQFLGAGGNDERHREYAFDIANSGGVRPWDNRMPETDGNGVGDRYNFAPVNYLLTPAERINLGAFGHIDLNDHVTAYAELMYVDSRNALQLAPTPATNVEFDPNSPLLSQQARDLLAQRANDPTAPGLLTRRMVEMGPRIQENESKLQQLTVGFRGDLGIGDLQYDAYYQFGRTEFTNVTYNDVSRSRFSAGLSNCPADYVRFVPGCVPVNAFGVNSISEEAADFIRLNFTDVLLFERNMFSAAVNGSLFDMPAGPVGFAVGVEYREDSSSYRPDIAKEQGDILGFNAQQAIDGKFDVSEVFVEALVPLLADVPAVHSLDLELGVRYSDYSSIGSVSAYKAGLAWTPTSGVNVRTMYQRANRAPSVFELYRAGDQGFTNAADRCSSINANNGEPVTVSPDVAAFCRDVWGIDATSYVQTDAQIEGFFYGNPDLQEETSDTFTIGVALQPASVPTLQVALDYWTIKVEDYIDTFAGGVGGVLAGCFAALDMTSDACFSNALGQEMLYRDAVGDLKVRVPLANVSELKTSGVDLQIGYEIPVPFARGAFANGLQANLLVTYLDEYVLDDIDYAGTVGWYNILATLPELKANLRLTYPIGPVTLTYNLQYLDKMDNQGNIPEFEDGGYLGVGSHVYHDISANWAITEQYELNAGVRNLSDKRPPFFDWAVDMNTDPSAYDVLGRQYFASFRAKF